MMISIIGSISLMTENIKQMQQRHVVEIDELQRNCAHIEKSDWQDRLWQWGRVSHSVKVCLFCGKTMEIKRPKHDA